MAVPMLWLRAGGDWSQVEPYNPFPSCIAGRPPISTPSFPFPAGTLQRLGSPLEEILLIEQASVLGILVWGVRVVTEAPLEGLGQSDTNQDPGTPPNTPSWGCGIQHNLHHSRGVFSWALCPFLFFLVLVVQLCMLLA